MRLSVIVPCYNIGAKIKRCLNSILNQSFRDMEVIVVDDGSTDDSGDLARSVASLDSRVRVIRQDNAGLGPARNTGIEAAEGDILSFIDGDDWILPGMYQRMIGAMEDSGAQMAVCRYVQVSDTEKPETAQNTVSGDGAGDAPRCRLLTRDEAMKALVSEPDDIVIQNAAWNKLYRHELFEDGTLRYPTHRYEDIVITAKLLYRCSTVAYIDEPFYAYVTDRQDSIMNKSRLKDLLAEQIPSYWERDDFLESEGRHDLVLMHDYIVGKKLLELHTVGRKRGEKADVAELDRVIKERYAPRTDEIYSCPIADSHHALRMRLFLKSPALYDAFTAVNDGIVLPARRALAGRGGTR